MASKKPKKAISKTQKSLQNKIYYLNRKNKKVKNELSNFDSETFYKIGSKKVKETFKGVEFKQKDKVKGSTLINILRNKIKDNNTQYDKVFSHLKKRFKKDLKPKKQKNVTRKKGLYLSPEFRAWEQNIAVSWIEVKAENDKKLFEYTMQIAGVFLTMGNYDFAQMSYDKNKLIFDVYIIEND